MAYLVLPITVFGYLLLALGVLWVTVEEALAHLTGFYSEDEETRDP